MPCCLGRAPGLTLRQLVSDVAGCNRRPATPERPPTATPPTIAALPPPCRCPSRFVAPPCRWWGGEEGGGGRREMCSCLSSSSSPSPTPLAAAVARCASLYAAAAAVMVAAAAAVATAALRTVALCGGGRGGVTCGAFDHSRRCHHRLAVPRDAAEVAHRRTTHSALHGSTLLSFARATCLYTAAGRGTGATCRGPGEPPSGPPSGVSSGGRPPAGRTPGPPVARPPKESEQLRRN